MSLDRVLKKVIGKIKNQTGLVDRGNKQSQNVNSVTSQIEPFRDIRKTTYLKMLVLRKPEDIESVKRELEEGNVIIINFVPLADRSLEEARKAVELLAKFAEEISGDIAQLGKKWVIVTPQSIKIWREQD